MDFIHYRLAETCLSKAARKRLPKSGCACPKFLTARSCHENTLISSRKEGNISRSKSNLNEWLSVFQVSSNVLNQSGSRWFIENFGPEGSYLAEVVIISRIVTGNVSRHLDFVFHGLWNIARSREAVGEIVGVPGVVRIKRHRSISLIIQRTRPERTVDRKVKVIGTQSVTVSIGVREKATLEHLNESQSFSCQWIISKFSSLKTFSKQFNIPEASCQGLVQFRSPGEPGWRRFVLLQRNNPWDYGPAPNDRLQSAGLRCGARSLKDHHFIFFHFDNYY